VEHHDTDPVRAGHRRRVLITGAGGQLGRALQGAFADDCVVALTRSEWDVTFPPSDKASQGEFDLVLHAAAWTDVDGAEDDPQGATAVNVGGTAHVAELGAPLVVFSTDYVFDGRAPDPYVESDSPNPLSAYGRSKLLSEAAAGEDAWIVRTSWLFGPTGHNFVRTMLRLGAEHEELAVVASGDCTWADFAEAIFAEAGLDSRVRRISSHELGRPAPRPAYAVLRSERPGAPLLPHWREGLQACLADMALQPQ
jgi:dTDP-4-dehydrorhamnose reductase